MSFLERYTNKRILELAREQYDLDDVSAVVFQGALAELSATEDGRKILRDRAAVHDIIAASINRPGGEKYGVEYPLNGALYGKVIIADTALKVYGLPETELDNLRMTAEDPRMRSLAKVVSSHLK